MLLTVSKCKLKVCTVLFFLLHFIQIYYEFETEPVQRLATDPAYEMSCEI